MNLVILIGRLTADPEYSTSSTGTNIAKYSLAVDRQVKKDGQATADFLRCTCFGKNADFAAKYLYKGMKIAIEGNLRTGSYEKDGVKHYTTDVIVARHEFCEKASGDRAAASAGAPTPPPDEYGFTEIPSDDIPF